jgi:hypothetical protein
MDDKDLRTGTYGLPGADRRRAVEQIQQWADENTSHDYVVTEEHPYSGLFQRRRWPTEDPAEPVATGPTEDGYVVPIRYGEDGPIVGTGTLHYGGRVSIRLFSEPDDYPGGDRR